MKEIQAIGQTLIGRRRVWQVLVVALLLASGWKALRLAYLGQTVRQDVAVLRTLAADPTPETIASAGPTIAAARRDLVALRREAGPFLWLTPLFGWMPTYGADLAAARPLLDLAGNLLIAADEANAGLTPLMQAALGVTAHPKPGEIVGFLAAARPHLLTAKQAADEAAAARSQISLEQLSPKTRNLVEKVDALLPLLRGGLAMAIAAPELLGADSPKTYLILLQNEDELRATGGFISAVGRLTVEHGEIVSMQIEDSFAVDDPALIYPPAPEPLRRYMGLPLWYLRDVNWSPDFPFTAAVAEALYTAARPQATIDGVIAVDQSAVRLVLGATGPLTVAGAPEPISADNVSDYLRAAWQPEPGQGLTVEWWTHRKDFMANLAAALLDKALWTSWIDLGRAALQALNERQALVWLKDPAAAEALAEQGWDGAIRPGDGDYLMVVESNIGFNKVNAILQTQLHYSVDLSHPATPLAALTVVDFNPAVGRLPCRHEPSYGSGQYADLIARCYWNYLRVYTRAGTTLLDATPHAVPGDWMRLGAPVPAEVSLVDYRNGAQAFGTLLVVPFGERLATDFRLSLAPGVLASAADTFSYNLHIQKQPGTQAVPLFLRVQLPKDASLIGAIPAGVLDGNTWSLDLLLTTDTDVGLRFRAP